MVSTGVRSTGAPKRLVAEDADDDPDPRKKRPRQAGDSGGTSGRCARPGASTASAGGRLNEMQYPEAKRRASKEGGVSLSGGGHGGGHPFLLQVPCSWGGLLFGAHVADFLALFDARSVAPFYNFSAEAEQSGYGKERQELGDARVRLPNQRAVQHVGALVEALPHRLHVRAGPRDALPVV